jgi:hypothetical protein
MMAASLGLRTVPKTNFTPDRSSEAPTDNVATAPSRISGGSNRRYRRTGGWRSDSGSSAAGGVGAGSGTVAGVGAGAAASLGSILVCDPLDAIEVAEMGAC